MGKGSCPPGTRTWGTIGRTGMPSSLARPSRLPKFTYCSSAPTMATGTMGDWVSMASRMKPVPKGCSR